jgi:death on curing protein
MTKEPAWITKPIARAIHEYLLAEHGSASGLRDEGLLDSALASPVNRFHYGETDIIALAAAYAYALSRNHPFVDGNKRVAFVIAITFLELNGIRFTAPETEVVERTLALAAREIGEEDYAAWLKARSVAG